MSHEKIFETADLDLTAAIMTGTGNPPVIGHQRDGLVIFEFIDNEVTRAIVIAFATGQLVQPVKRFAAARAWLFRQVKGGRR
ncbi:hypothetical protein [Geomesophilobacter sediminis]|uniref:DUF5659 domain-containing protein n=1 Tax=Geomesophilobacter sediminis TaxID=2798584 RepID=A0A8J7LYT2_9BACT|nr:hypothetical protein [Geomesophilobacter sediminis]MBJ6725407.1 hypothetical protein [Geomesophilobacter sediminis]